MLPWRALELGHKDGWWVQHISITRPWVVPYWYTSTCKIRRPSMAKAEEAPVVNSIPQNCSGSQGRLMSRRDSTHQKKATHVVTVQWIQSLRNLGAREKYVDLLPFCSCRSVEDVNARSTLPLTSFPRRGKFSRPILHQAKIALTSTRKFENLGNFLQYHVARKPRKCMIGLPLECTKINSRK